MPRNIAKGLTYADALAILGATDSRAVDLIGSLGLGPAASAAGAVVPFVDFGAVKDGVIDHAQSMARGIRERLSGASRLDRTQRIAAAHTVIVLAAFYGSVAEALAAAGIGETDFAMPAAEQIAVAGGGGPQLVAVARQNLDGLAVPLPSPELSFEDVKRRLSVLHGRLLANVRTFLSGLAVGERDPRRVNDALDAVTVGDFLRRYEISYRALAVDVPEFAVWTQLTDGQATRTVIASRLDGLMELLAAQSDGARVAARRKDLATVYAGLLTAPVLGSADSLDNVTVPTLEQGYVNPAGHVRVAGRIDLPSTESWWEGARPLADVQPFLAGYLSSPQAVEGPLVVLGQPGSGKSVLTKMLAARLPEVGFFPVRVTLRNVNADSSVRQQIEDAVYAAIGRRTEWADLAEDAGNTLPVVMLDGFDELLQAAGTNKADYLEEVQQFQRTEAALGRPVAVVVTSRVVVADRARFPEGTMVLRLDPFERPQVEEWLTTWYAVNPHLPMLTADEMVTHGAELAGQPLLLMMLALYAAGGNSLTEPGQHRAALYEKLLTDFAKREIRKHSPDLSPDDAARAVQDELHRLSLVAVGAFVRRSQTITDTEIDADLAVLLPAPGGGSTLTAAQVVSGRFFFVHESTATEQTGRTSRTYEFLHATFGEYLIARYIHRAITRLTEDRTYFASRPGGGQPDGGPLRAALSFAAVSGRETVADFYRGLVALLPDGRREEHLATLRSLLPDVLYPHQAWTLGAYEPLRLPVTLRYAAFSANLVLLLVLTASAPVPLDSFLDATDPADQWRQFAALWRSQLTDEEWTGLWQVIRVRVEQARTVTLHLEDGSDVTLDASLPDGNAGDGRIGAGTNAGELVREAAFRMDLYVEVLIRYLGPYLRRAAGTEMPYGLLNLVLSDPAAPPSLRSSRYVLAIRATPSWFDLYGRALAAEFPAFAAVDRRDVLEALTEQGLESAFRELLDRAGEDSLDVVALEGEEDDQGDDQG